MTKEINETKAKKYRKLLLGSFFHYQSARDSNKGNELVYPLALYNQVRKYVDNQENYWISNVETDEMRIAVNFLVNAGLLEKVKGSGGPLQLNKKIEKKYKLERDNYDPVDSEDDEEIAGVILDKQPTISTVSTSKRVHSSIASSELSSGEEEDSNSVVSQEVSERPRSVAAPLKKKSRNSRNSRDDTQSSESSEEEVEKVGVSKGLLTRSRSSAPTIKRKSRVKSTKVLPVDSESESEESSLSSYSSDGTEIYNLRDKRVIRSAKSKSKFKSKKSTKKSNQLSNKSAGQELIGSKYFTSKSKAELIAELESQKLQLETVSARFLELKRNLALSANRQEDREQSLTEIDSDDDVEKALGVEKRFDPTLDNDDQEDFGGMEGGDYGFDDSGFNDNNNGDGDDGLTIASSSNNLNKSNFEEEIEFPIQSTPKKSSSFITGHPLSPAESDSEEISSGSNKLIIGLPSPDLSSSPSKRLEKDLSSSIHGEIELEENEEDQGGLKADLDEAIVISQDQVSNLVKLREEFESNTKNFNEQIDFLTFQVNIARVHFQLIMTNSFIQSKELQFIHKEEKRLLIAESKKLLEEREKLEDMVIQHTTTVQESQLGREATEEKLANSVEELKNVSNEREKLESTVAELNTTIQDSQLGRTDVEERLAISTEELKNIEIEKEKLESTITQLNSNVQESQLGREVAEEKLTILSEELKNVEMEREKLEATVTQLNSNVQESQLGREAVEEKLTILSEELKNIEMEKEKSEATVTQLNSNVQESQLGREAVEEKLAISTEELKNLSAEKEKIETRYVELTKEAEKLITSTTETDLVLSNANSKIKLLQDKLVEMEDGTCKLMASYTSTVHNLNIDLITSITKSQNLTEELDLVTLSHQSLATQLENFKAESKTKSKAFAEWYSVGSQLLGGSQEEFDEDDEEGEQELAEAGEIEVVMVTEL